MKEFMLKVKFGAPLFYELPGFKDKRGKIVIFT